MRVVTWPSAVAKKAEVWRVLDLSGMTTSVRQSRNFVKANFVYLNGELVTSLQDKMDIGKDYRLEIRFPNGVVKTQIVRLVPPTNYRARSNQPLTRYHKP